MLLEANKRCGADEERYSEPTLHHYQLRFPGQLLSHTKAHTHIRISFTQL